MKYESGKYELVGVCVQCGHVVVPSSICRRDGRFSYAEFPPVCPGCGEMSEWKTSSARPIFRSGWGGYDFDHWELKPENPR